MLAPQSLPEVFADDLLQSSELTFHGHDVLDNAPPPMPHLPLAFRFQAGLYKGTAQNGLPKAACRSSDLACR